MSVSPIPRQDQNLTESPTRSPSPSRKELRQSKLNTGHTVIFLCAETGRPFVIHEDQGNENGFRIVKAHEYSLTNPSARFAIKRKGKYASFKSVENGGLSIGCSDANRSLDILPSQLPVPHRASKNCFTEKNGSEALWFYFISEPVSQYWLRQNVILVSKRFPQMAFQLQLIIIPLNLRSTESLLLEWFALAQRAVSLREALFAIGIKNNKKAISPARLCTGNGSRRLESRGSLNSEDVSFLEFAQEVRCEKDNGKESLDDENSKCQVLSLERRPGSTPAIASSRIKYMENDADQPYSPPCLDMQTSSNMGKGQCVVGIDKERMNQKCQPDLEETTSQNTDLTRRESLPKYQGELANGSSGNRVIIYPEKSIQTDTCPEHSRFIETANKINDAPDFDERDPDPWTNKINQVSRWLENSTSREAILRVSVSCSNRPEEEHSTASVFRGIEEEGTREDGNCTGCHHGSGSTTTICTGCNESANVITGLQDVLDALNDTVKEGSLLNVTTAAAKLDRRVIDKMDVRAVKTLFATNGVLAPELDHFVRKIAHNSSYSSDELDVMKLEDFLDIATKYQLPAEEIEHRISELLQLSDVVAKEKQELENIARYGLQFDSVASNSSLHEEKTSEITSKAMDNSSSDITQAKRVNYGLSEACEKAFKPKPRDQTNFSDEARTEGYLWEAGSCSGRAETCIYSEAAVDGVTTKWKRVQRLRRIRRQRV